MSPRPPEFDDLIDPEISGPERDRLRRVHDLLVAVGPPPDLSKRHAPDPNVVPLRRPARRRRVLLALAAALGVAAIFTLGLVAAVDGDPTVDRVVALSGPSGASASLEILEIDEAGNWPMVIYARGLRPSKEGALFELWLTKNGARAALCGSFLADAEGSAVVALNAPWRLSDFDGWAVVEQGSETPVLSTA